MNNSCLLFESLLKSNVFPVSVKNVKNLSNDEEGLLNQWENKRQLEDILVRKEMKGRQLESSFPTPALLSLKKKKGQSLSESNF